MRVKAKFGADVSVRPDGLDGVVLSISIDGDSARVTLSKEAALALSALLATTTRRKAVMAMHRLVAIRGYTFCVEAQDGEIVFESWDSSIECRLSKDEATELANAILACVANIESEKEGGDGDDNQ